MITIRRARPEDAAAIQLLNKEALGYDYPLDKTREKLEKAAEDQRTCLLVAAFDQDTVIGYVHMTDYDTLYFGHLKNVLAIAVFTEFRRRGAATKLLTAGEQWARDTGAVGIRLVSGENRTEAHAFYERMGYTLRKMQKNFVKTF